MKSLLLFRQTLWWLAAFWALSASGQETQRQLLSGPDKDNPVPWRFFCTAGAQSGYWTNIPVPSNWELHGFGALSYQRDPTNAVVEQGRYEYDFRVPAAWSRGRVWLVFEGVMTDAEVRLNGRPAGPAHQGSFYRFKYEVTPLLRYTGSNRLEVLVKKKSDNASVNTAERQGDYWIFGGIYRPVYLEATPREFIDRVAIDAQAGGAFAMDVFVDAAHEGDRVEAQIVELDGTPAGELFGVVLSGTNRQKAELRTEIPSPRPWTAETPNLYRVNARLVRGRGTLHQFSERFGFRTVEVRDGDGIYVNGRRVILKGANRHSFWPDSGRTLSEGVHRMDIELMKEANLNAVRMSHYPPDKRFLELCDELGLYVLNELAGWHGSYDAVVGRKLVEEMVTRDVNHPSILFWDNGNEGGWNVELDNEFAKWDPQKRRVLHPWTTFNGVNTAHYLTYDRMQRALAGEPNYRGASGRDAEIATNTNSVKFIHLPTEFLHGMFDGGAGAGLADYWSAMRMSPLFAGGFLWAWVDEGVRRPDTGEIDVFGNRAPDGILGPYREREGSFYTIKEIWSPVQISVMGAERGEMVRPTNTFVDLRIENRYDFIDTSGCEFYWYLFRSAGPASPSNHLTGVALRRAYPPVVPPGGQDMVRLHLPTNWHEADLLGAHVIDPDGRMLCRWTWPLPGIERFRQLPDSPAAGRVAGAETPEAIEMRADDLTVRINRQTGLLDSVQRGRQRWSLSNGPRLASGNATLTNLQWQADGPDYLVGAEYSGDLKSVLWIVRGNGWVSCEFTYRPGGTSENGVQGVLFDYPERLVEKKRWLGNGPYRVWQNRREGASLFLWANDYNNTITGWRDWVYPEFKGCFADVHWMQLQTAEGMLTVVPVEVPFVQVLTPEFPPTNLVMRAGVSLPPAGLGFLHAIPPIGNKFHTARETGLQGRTVELTGELRGAVSFYFGE